MAAVTLQPAATLTFDKLTTAFNSGYAGYIVPVNVGEDQLRHHIDNHDIDLGLSWIATDADTVAGFVLLGTRQQNGWIGGLGVHPDYRRQGIGRQLMQAAIDTASSNKVEQLYLEVIVGNTAAYDLYLDLGFKELRRLLVLDSGSSGIYPEKSKHPVHSATVNDALQHFNRLHNTPLPWQRQHETLAKLDADSTQSWFVTHNNQVQAYVIGRATENGIQFYDLAFAPDHEDALSAVVSHVHQQYPEANARMVNLGDDDPAWPVLQSLGYQEVLSQHEMLLSR